MIPYHFDKSIWKCPAHSSEPVECTDHVDLNAEQHLCWFAHTYEQISYQQSLPTNFLFRILSVISALKRKRASIRLHFTANINRCGLFLWCNHFIFYKSFIFFFFSIILYLFSLFTNRTLGIVEGFIFGYDVSHKQNALFEAPVNNERDSEQIDWDLGGKRGKWKKSERNEGGERPGKSMRKGEREKGR